VLDGSGEADGAREGTVVELALIGDMLSADGGLAEDRPHPDSPILLRSKTISWRAMKEDCIGTPW
jgi:hypothetical protein